MSNSLSYQGYAARIEFSLVQKMSVSSVILQA
jgi:hypothetical protein